MPLYGTLWSYVNGMETSLTIFAMALVGWKMVRHPLRGRRPFVLLGLALTCLVLARLDTAMVAAGLLGVLGFVGWRSQSLVLSRRVRVAAVTLGAFMVAYLVVNKLYAGSALPVSGSLKSTFPSGSFAMVRDAWRLATGDHALATIRFYRDAPVFGTAAVAALYLAFSGRRAVQGRRRSSRLAPPVRSRTRNSGSASSSPEPRSACWPSPPTTSSTCRSPTRGTGTGRSPRPSSASSPSSGSAPGSAREPPLPTLSGAGGRGGGPWEPHRRPAGGLRRVRADVGLPPALRRLRQAGGPSGQELLWRPEAQGHRARRRHQRLALGLPALSGTGLALDKEDADAYSHGRLLDLAYRRIVSLAYLNGSGLTARTSSAGVQRRIARLLPGQDLSNFRYGIGYRSRDPLTTPLPQSDGSYVVITFEPR